MTLRFCLLLLTAFWGIAAPSSIDRPNVIIILLDDLNDWVGCLGGYPGEVRTPHIDALARRGTLFTNAHCASPVCNPSRTALLTGRMPSTTGIYDNGRWWRPALPDVRTLPEWFRQQGYRVAGGGKVFHHTPGFNPPDQWDTYFSQVFDDPFHRPGPDDALPIRGVHWPAGFPLNRIANVREGKRPPANALEFDWGPFLKADMEMGDGQMVAWAEEQLRQLRDKPFFLAAGIFRPHLPWYAPAEYFDGLKEDQVVLPLVREDDWEDIPKPGRRMAEARRPDFELVKGEGRFREAVKAYLACIQYADALVGRLVAALDAGPNSDNTIVVLASDHGWHLGEKLHWHKMTLWEEATRVPLIVVAPGVTRPGTRCERPVGLIDLYPTLTDLCGLPSPKDLDGVSLRPLLEDPGLPWDRPALITYGRGNHAVRDERWRYIRYADGSEELYDHQSDPYEWHNLADEPAAEPVKRRLGRRLPETEAPAAPPKSKYRFDPASYTWNPRDAK